MNAISKERARICVPVCVRRADELAPAVERAAPFADLIELRLDCLDADAQLDAALQQLPALLRARPRPFILTFRPAAEGGRRELDAETRFDFWARRLRPLFDDAATRPDFVDLELDLVSDPRRRDGSSAARGRGAGRPAGGAYPGRVADFCCSFRRR